jgi:hypothetical protein
MIEFSKHLGRAFCYPCRIFKQNLARKAEASFIKDGFKDWHHFIPVYNVRLGFTIKNIL